MSRIEKHFDLKLHYACNNNCIHCVIAQQREAALSKRGQDWISTADAVRLLIRARRQGFTLVTLTGGEPTIRKDLPTIARAAYHLRYRVIGIQTNARVLSVWDVAKRLSGMGIHFVVALHGSNAEVHDSITRAPGSFAQTVQGIKNLVELKEWVVVKTVISKPNVTDLPRLAEFGLELGVRRFNFTFPHAIGNAARFFDLVVPPYSQLMPYLNKAFEVLESQRDTEIWTETVPLCLLGPKRLKYSTEYTILREVRSISYQLDEGLRDWTRDRWNEEKAKSPRCKLCKYNNVCEGVWEEYIEHFGDQELIPVKA